MQPPNIDREQQHFKQEIEEIKAEIAALAKQRDTLEQEYARSSAIKQKLGRYFGVGASRKLEWINFKLKFKQEQLLALGNHPETRINEDTSRGPSATPPTATEIIHEKLERMANENPHEPEPDIRRVYQRLHATEQTKNP